LPYITEKFPKEYIFAYYIGESFSALIPGALALIQGVTMNAECRNSTVLTSHVDELTQVTTQLYKQKLTPVKLAPTFSVLIYFVVIFMFNCVSSAVYVLIDCLPFVKQHYRKSIGETTIELKRDTEKVHGNKGLSPEGFAKEKAYLLFLNFLVTFFFFGFLPGIQSFSTIPYGNMVFSLSINLSKVISRIFNTCTTAGFLYLAKSQ